MKNFPSANRGRCTVYRPSSFSFSCIKDQHATYWTSRHLSSGWSCFQAEICPENTTYRSGEWPSLILDPTRGRLQPLSTSWIKIVPWLTHHTSRGRPSVSRRSVWQNSWLTYPMVHQPRSWLRNGLLMRSTRSLPRQRHPNAWIKIERYTFYPLVLNVCCCEWLVVKNLGDDNCWKCRQNATMHLLIKSLADYYLARSMWPHVLTHWLICLFFLAWKNSERLWRISIGSSSTKLSKGSIDWWIWSSRNWEPNPRGISRSPNWWRRRPEQRPKWTRRRRKRGGKRGPKGSLESNSSLNLFV